MPDESRAGQFSTEAQHQPITQSPTYIDQIIEPQFKDSIFYDPNFFKNFLFLAPSPVNVVVLSLRYDWHLRIHHRWEFPDKINGKQCLRQPVLHLLNTIKSAKDVVLSSIPYPYDHTVPDLADENPPKYKDYHLPLDPQIQQLTFPDRRAQHFKDCSTRDLAHDLSIEIIPHLRPDIILFRSKRQHWSNIRFIVEIKEDPQYLAAGIKQLARYAHVVFASQPGRRHFYSLLICGTSATFVRFDHAGILYSRFLDVATNPAFATALASLLSIDAVDQGIDPAFRYEKDAVYINLLECMLGKDKAPVGGSDVRQAMKTTRFRVLNRTYNPLSKHRVTGPGTFVFRIREDFSPGHKGDGKGANSKQEAETRLDGSDGTARPPAEYTLKLSWRLDNGRSEGQALEEAEGTFGIPQHVSHGDIVMPGKCRCLLPPGAPVPQAQCTTCVDRTPILNDLQVYSNLHDLSVSDPLENGGGASPGHLDLGESFPVPNSARINRIYSYVLLTSFGNVMGYAESPEIYLNAMMDAIFGYWGLYNLGIIHRNIAPFNLLISTEEQELTHARWEKGQQIQDPVLADSEAQLRRTLEAVGTGSPIGMLIDLSIHERLLHAKAPLFPEVVDERRSLPHNFLENGPSRPKKRKGNSGGSVPTTSTTTRRTRRVRIPTFAGDGPQPPFGYLACFNEQFHSTRIARMALTPQLQYQHHFYDDLESFFWVMFWETISHVDPGKTRNEHATRYRTRFYHADVRCLHIDWKKKVLDDCLLHAGRDTLKMLSTCQNEWASSRLLQNAIVSLGFYIGALRKEERVYSPGEVFKSVIDILQRTLKTDA